MARYSSDSQGCADWFKWLVGIVVALLAAGGGIVALLNYIDPPRPLPTVPPTPPPTTTSTLSLQRVSIKGTVLSIDLPNWATDPVRGSITFNKDDEIAKTGKMMVYLSVRNEQRTKWIDSEPEVILELHSGEQFCSIVPAEHNTTNFYLGFQAHCASSDACSYNIEGKRLWATIDNAEAVIAPRGVQCPDR